jgi:hypothetical protein
VCPRLEEFDLLDRLGTVKTTWRHRLVTLGLAAGAMAVALGAYALLLLLLHRPLA